ncbi:MAG: hypothetical protein WDA20_07120 [Desulfuromonadales bacterium]
MDVEEEKFAEGKKQIAEVATRYAGQHGLQPRKIRWDERGFDLMLIFETDRHQVDIPFSVDEVAYYPEGVGNDVTKRKIRDKFAGLSI